jgi:hypothetical protein
MTWRLGILLIAGTILFGCAGSGGPSLASLPSLGPPKAGTARIVVLRLEKGFFGIGDRSFPVKLDGEPMGDLMTGTFVYQDRPAGRHQLSAELWDLPGVSRHDFTARPGQTHYFVARLKDKVRDIYAASAVGGLIGLAIASAATDDNTGNFDLTPIDEAAAKRAIAQLP